jgi:hypothetical protein
MNVQLFRQESWTPFVVILIAICMIEICLMVRMTEGPCWLLCLAKMRHLPSGVTCQGETWLYHFSKFPLESISGCEAGVQKNTVY